MDGNKYNYDPPRSFYSTYQPTWNSYALRYLQPPTTQPPPTPTPTLRQILTTIQSPPPPTTTPQIKLKCHQYHHSNDEDSNVKTEELSDGSSNEVPNNRVYEYPGDLPSYDDWKEIPHDGDDEDSDNGSSPQQAKRACHQNRFTPYQICVLVEHWTKRYTQLQCLDGTQHSHWHFIHEEVNSTGKPKTIRQIKKKIQTLKGKYKAIKKLKLDGREHKTWLHFEAMDSVLGEGYRETSVPSSEQPSNESPPPNQNDESSQYPDCPDTPIGRALPNESDNRNSRKRQRSTRFDFSTDDISTTLIEWQERQTEQLNRFVETLCARMEAMEERAHERNKELLLMLVEAMNK